MALNEYRKKRTFADTPEPKGDTSGSPSRWRFSLQRHQARHVHYDLRLEHNGVLLSWAVPKGPSLQPLSKRLAVATEDHPLEYLAWEGTIPEGNYGAGVMMVFDIGYWESVGNKDVNEALAQGEIKLKLWGQKVAGEWTLVRTKGSQWLWIKKDDSWSQTEWDPEDYPWSAASGRTWNEVSEGRRAPEPKKRAWPQRTTSKPLPRKVQPMLAHIAEPFDDEDWAFEVKWDGLRAIATCQVQSLTIESRGGNSLLKKFPEFQELRARVAAESFVLDGEIVVVDAGGSPQFSEVASRFQISDRNLIEASARSHRAVFYAFDLLYLDGRDLRSLDWTTRRQLLTEVFRPDGWVRLSEALPGSGRDIFRAVTAQGLEGVVAKKRSSPYVEGRSRYWLKLKAKQSLTCSVVGFTAPKGTRSGIGSLLLARELDGRWEYMGRVGTGMSSQPLKEWKARLQECEVDSPIIEDVPKATTKITWCSPKFAVEVEFAELTPGGKLRHPVYIGLASKTPPKERVVEKATAAKENAPSTAPKVKISNPKKILFPDVKLTKGDLIAYYGTFGPTMLTHLIDRPLSLRRYPDGVNGQDFFQKHPAPGFAEWIPVEEVKPGDEAIFCDQAMALEYFAQLASIEIHATLSRRPHLDSPDGLLFDLDPQFCEFEKIKTVARYLKMLLDDLGWQAQLKTTGSRGLHVFVPLKAGYSFEHSRLAAGVMADILRRRYPKLITLVRTPAKRPKNSVYIDVPQNRTAATMACAYSVRATSVASVSAPLRWSELDSDLGPRDFTITTMPARLEAEGDLWSMTPNPRQTLEDALPKLEEMLRK